MSPHRKRRFRRWSLRILLIVILLPVIALAIVRSAGWLRMRKTDREIQAFLGPYQVNAVNDTLKLRGRDIVYLKTGKGEQKKSALILVHIDKRYAKAGSGKCTQYESPCTVKYRTAEDNT